MIFYIECGMLYLKNKLFDDSRLTLSLEILHETDTDHPTGIFGMVAEPVS